MGSQHSGESSTGTKSETSKLATMMNEWDKIYGKSDKFEDVSAPRTTSWDTELDIAVSDAWDNEPASEKFPPSVEKDWNKLDVLDALDRIEEIEEPARLSRGDYSTSNWAEWENDPSIIPTPQETHLATAQEAPRTIRAFNNYPHPSMPPSKSATSHLDMRDANAIQYSKSQLQDGDTLVVIQFPNNQKAYDEHGFEISTKHLVHAEKLLATGSSKFKAILEDQWEQHKHQRKCKAIGNKPPGVEYFLELTPPEEGDEALALTAKLSCPEGFLRWYLAAERLNISGTLIGGHDATTNPQPPLDQIDLLEDDLPPSARSRAFSAIRDGINEPDIERPFSVARREIIDYDPLRHRTGITTLLQIIEGKTVRLDSAPKIWTLAVLAEYFDCRAVVMDYIFTWVWADPNCRIIEVLPESTLRLGMILESPRLVQTAFSVLVSEEALDIGTKVYHPSPKVSRAFGRKETKFHRLIESLDDTTASMVEYAGEAFAARIDKVITELHHPEMKWVSDLPSMDPLKALAQHLESYGGNNLEKLMEPITTLQQKLKEFVRGRIVWCYLAELDVHQITRATEHRSKEVWKDETIENFGNMYNRLGEKEKIATRFFWEILRDLDWGIHCRSNLVGEPLSPNQAAMMGSTHARADERGIPQVTIYELMNRTTLFNKQVLQELKIHKYNNGQALRPDPNGNSAMDTLGKLVDTSANPELDDAYIAWTSLDSFIGNISTAGQEINPLNPSETTAGFYPTVPSSRAILPEQSIYFSLVNFFLDVNSHVAGVCAPMLSRGDNDWSTLCDTLLCLTDEEYKFLPLYAGGLNDDTGGVFADQIPAAEKGPIGPGPGFSTGSTIGSCASTVDDDSWDRMTDVVSESDMGGVDSSMGVEDGYSDHVDRRRGVFSEDDFPEEDVVQHINLPYRTAPAVGNGKGKEIEGTKTVENTKDVKELEKDDVMSDGFFDTPDYEEDTEFSGFDDDDDGELTE